MPRPPPTIFIAFSTRLTAVNSLVTPRTKSKMPTNYTQVKWQMRTNCLDEFWISAASPSLENVMDYVILEWRLSILLLEAPRPSCRSLAIRWQPCNCSIYIFSFPFFSMQVSTTYSQIPSLRPLTVYQLKDSLLLHIQLQYFKKHYKVKHWQISEQRANMSFNIHHPFHVNLHWWKINNEQKKKKIDKTVN